MSDDKRPEDDAPAAPPAPAAPKAQTAGRGLALITMAKLWFMVGGAAISFLLPRMFPRDVSVARYGEWGTVLSWMSVLNNVIVTGSIQMVSRFASRGPEWVEGSKRTALRINALAVSAIALAYFLAAPLIADFEHDPDLATLLRLSTGVVLAYGLYAVFVGAANGAREFHKQAGLDMTFTTLRAALVLAGALVLSSVMGAVGGFVTAAVSILVLAVFVVGWGPVEKRPRAAEMVGFIAPVAAYLLVMNALMFIDYWWLKRLIAEGAAAAGALPLDAARIADAMVGRYNAALQIARLPYQAIIAVTFVVFPLVSQAEFSSDLGKVRGYIDKAIRLSLLVVTTVAVAVAARPEALLALLFPKNAVGVNEFVGGAPALAILMFAYVAYSLFSIAGTIINGAGDAKSALRIGVFTVVLDAGLTYFAIKWALAGGENPLAAAAAGSATAIGVGLLLSLVHLQRRFGASVRPSTVVRVAAAALAGVLVGRLLPASLVTASGAVGHAARLGACVAGATAYLAVLLASRELSVGEIAGLLKRRKPAAAA